MPEWTTVVGVDRKTLEQLKWSHATWRRNAPELWQQPMLVFYDQQQVAPRDVGFLEHPRLTCVTWPPSDCEYESQREKMLCGFVHMPRLIETTWWLKLDTDAIKLDERPWYEQQWFDQSYVFIGNRWPYTKPAEQMGELDDWGDRVTGLREHQRLNLEHEPGARTCRHPGGRLASWIAFFRTDWSRMVADFCVLGSVPVPSEDGYHFYCAKRRGDPYLLTKFKRRGWTNISRFNRLCEQVMQTLELPT